MPSALGRVRDGCGGRVEAAAALTHRRHLSRKCLEGSETPGAGFEEGTKVATLVDDGKPSFSIRKNFFMSPGSECKQAAEGQGADVEFLFLERLLSLDCQSV